MRKTGKCALCGQPYDHYGNNPTPLPVKGRVCDDCNFEKVIPARLTLMRKT